MSLLQAILMGIIQGATEFLPVSSSGHLAIFKNIFGVETDTGISPNQCCYGNIGVVGPR